MVVHRPRLDLCKGWRASPPDRLGLTPGNIAATPRTEVMYVVTEHGMVNLKDKSVAERAMALISLAHPDYREHLERQSHEHRLIPHALVPSWM